MKSNGRIIVTTLLVTAGLLGMAGRLAYIMVEQAPKINQLAEDMRLVERKIPAIRGSILDRNGVPLAVSYPVYDVVANPLLMKEADEDEAVMKLPEILGVPAETIRQLLVENADRGYVPIKKGLAPREQEAIRSLKIEGIDVVERFVRDYPQGTVANHVVGFMNPEDTEGEYGLEAYYEKELAGTPGWVAAEWTGNGIPIEGTVASRIDPVPGRNLVLTIDASLNREAEKLLAKVVKEEDAKRALVIAMDVETGEILVMAMVPGADPGDRNTWGDPLEQDRVYNWAVEPLSPGSIFKPLTIAAALDAGAITTETVFYDKGWVEIDGWRIYNWTFETTDNPKPETAKELLARSSNIGLIQIGQRMGYQTFAEFLARFGFMEKSGIDFPGDRAALGVENLEEKRAIDWANMFIGQHIEPTPIQVIRAHAAIANGGYLVTPHLVREIRDAEGNVVWRAPTEKGRQAISAETAAEVREMMVYVIEEGTSRAAKPKGYTVGGKTGTAQKFEGGRMKDRMTATFTGFIPADKPRVQVLVMVDEPRGAGYGGVVAAPIFRELAPKIMQTLGIPPEQPDNAVNRGGES